ncbi:MAG: hemolysin III family protein [Vigna little leaf phytoplasma]|nr:hemolysin III family protein [Vigna little leaf phytoplasma]
MKWKIKKNKKQTIGEEIANSISHGLMIICNIIIFFIYFKTVDKVFFSWPLILFFISMFMLYLISCLYHALSFTAAKKNFQKFDHICIYLLIWSTFIPFLFPKNNIIDINLFFFLIQTIIVFLGIFFKIFWMNKGEKIHLFLYLLISWGGAIILLFLNEKIRNNQQVCNWLLLGGLFYTLGVYFYHNEYKKYYHFIWHIFVIIGNLCHNLSVYYFFNN